MCYLRNFTPIYQNIVTKHHDQANFDDESETKSFCENGLKPDFNFSTVEPVMPNNAYLFDQMLKVAQKSSSLLKTLEEVTA